MMFELNIIRLKSNTIWGFYSFYELNLKEIPIRFQYEAIMIQRNLSMSTDKKILKGMRQQMKKYLKQFLYCIKCENDFKMLKFINRALVAETMQFIVDTRTRTKGIPVEVLKEEDSMSNIQRMRAMLHYSLVELSDKELS